MPQAFDAENFLKEYERLGGVPLAQKNVAVFPTIDSTNSELLRRLSACTAQDVAQMENTLVAAACQTAGRGRMQRAFWSPDGTGLYFSLCALPKDGADDAVRFTVSAAVAVCRAVQKLFPHKKSALGIKWVNDVLLDGRKICGILTEGFVLPGAQTLTAAVIGIGINITMPGTAPGTIGSVAGGLLSEREAQAWQGGNDCDIRTALLSHIVRELTLILKQGENVIEEYKSYSVLIGKTVFVRPLAGIEESGYTAQVLDISGTAGLLVRLPDGTQTELHSGEVTLHGGE